MNKLINSAKEAVYRIIWILRQTGSIPGSRQYTRFIILTTIRSGSTMLRECLNAHSNAMCYFEIFHRHKDSIPFGQISYKQLSKSKSAKALREQDPPSFLKRYIWCLHNKRIKAVGFKLLYTQGWFSASHWWTSPPYDRWWRNTPLTLWGSRAKCLWTFFEQDTSIHVIHLFRENQLEAQVSAEEAHVSGHWGDGATGGFRSTETKKPILDPQACLEDFRAVERFRKEATLRFKNHPILEVKYEDLVGINQKRTWKSIEDFLGLPHHPISLKTRKLATKPLNKRIQNYEEVATTLKASPYSHFLDYY